MYPFRVRTSQTCLAGSQNDNENISVMNRLNPLSVPFSRFPIVLVSAKAILRYSANTSEFMPTNGFHWFLAQSWIVCNLCNAYPLNQSITYTSFSSYLSNSIGMSFHQQTNSLEIISPCGFSSLRIAPKPSLTIVMMITHLKPGWRLSEGQLGVTYQELVNHNGHHV